MSATAGTDQPSIVGSVANGSLQIPIPDDFFQALLYLEIPEFALKIESSITDFRFDKIGRVTLRTTVGDDVSVTLNLSGKLTDTFRVDEVSIDIVPVRQSPRAEFVSSTLFALIGLSQETIFQIPVLGLDLRQKFDLPLKRISQRLQMRQTSYRLMLIESATGVEFLIPQHLSAEDVKTIAYLYRAITLGSFAWPTASVTVHVPATLQRLAGFPADNTPTSQEVGPMPVVKVLFGHPINVGDEELVLEQAVFDNLDDIRRELAINDGHQVEVTVRSLTGIAKVILDGAPRLPETPWGPGMQALIDLEESLVGSLASRYSELAASTLADLNDQEKAELTLRPEMDETAFNNIGDNHGEKC
jgi:hypothetical protein